MFLTKENFMKTIDIINNMIMLIFSICYFYQFIYLIISFILQKEKGYNDKPNKIAILIAARNEEKVIGGLLESLKEQNYPKEYYDIYLTADNCSDKTALIAKSYGVTVFERENKMQVGKGYVLNFMLKNIAKLNKNYAGYIVFDADNIVDHNFIKEINRVYNDGHQIITSYRNSKNYADNWISAGYGLWYLHEACQLSEARMRLNSSCAVSGTGFFFSQEVLDKCHGWNFFLLTEDIEFSVFNIVNNERIAYAKKAIVYDEQPTDFKKSFIQRLRWSKGYLQVFQKYGMRLYLGINEGNFSCYDMFMNIAPAAILSFSSILLNVASFILGYGDVQSILKLVIGSYSALFVIGLTTTITQWNNIYCNNYKKIGYIFTFPLFMLTYIPISIIAIFAKVEWKPIEHNRSLTLQQIKKK